MSSENENPQIGVSFEVLEKRATSDLQEFEASIAEDIYSPRTEILRKKLIEKLTHPIRVVVAEERPKLVQQVKEFHEKFGHPVRTVPTIPSDEEVKFRLKLLMEEMLEIVSACFTPESISTDLAEIEHRFRSMMELGDVKVDLPAFADGIRDLNYVATGADLVFGIDGQPLADDVHRANIEKDAVYVQTKDGYHMGKTIKPTKPPEWVAPRIAELLRAQGWKG